MPRSHTDQWLFVAIVGTIGAFLIIIFFALALVKGPKGDKGEDGFLNVTDWLSLESLTITSFLFLNQTSSIILDENTSISFADDFAIKYDDGLECISLKPRVCVSEVAGNVTFVDSVSAGAFYLEDELLFPNGSLHSCCKGGNSSVSSLTTEGDLLYYGEEGEERLPIGNENQILAVVDGYPTWIDIIPSNDTEDFSEFEEHINSTQAHGATGAVVGTTNAQILTNKELDSITNNITVNGVDINLLLNQDVRNTSTPTFEGIYLSTTGGTPTLLSYYEKYDFDAHAIGPWNMEVELMATFVRIGSLCNLLFFTLLEAGDPGSPVGTIQPATPDDHIPERFRPVGTFSEVKPVVSAGINQLGLVTFFPSGTWEISSDANAPSSDFSADENIAGYNTFYATYQCGGIQPDR